MSRTAPYRLKHYHELKMSGSFSPESVIDLIHFATSLTLRQMPDISVFRVPIDDLDLYDVNHIDTGTRRSLDKRYGNDTRVYESKMAKINTAPLTGRIALSGLSMVGIGLDKPEMQLSGVLEIDDLEAIQQYDAAAVIEEKLRGQRYDSQILGRLTVGQSFDFGRPEFRAPQNEDYDSLVYVLSFNDKRCMA